MSESLSSKLAHFAVTLTYEDLPPEIVDKAKACTLHNMTSGLLGSGTPRGISTLNLIKKEESRSDGATILVDGHKATRMGAVFVNSDIMNVTNQCDSYRMLTHPGPILLPAALASAELEGKSGKDFITAVVAGYEVHNRIAKNFIPSTQARGFRSSSVYGTFGAAVATGKLLGLNEEKMMNAIALAVAATGGNLEGTRTGGGEFRIHEPNAARNGTLAALLAQDNDRCSDTILEGDAGFYHSFTGNNKGKLSYVYTGPKQTDLSSIVANLGKQYEMLNVTFKPYPTPGYNNPIIELMGKMKKQHAIDANQVKEITVEVNWLEITFPSPAFPREYLTKPRIGTIYYMTAYACIEGGYPQYGRWWERGGQGGAGDGGQNPKVLELMHQVRVVGSKERGFFSPKITVIMNDGSTFVDEYSGDEFKWDFEEDVRRLQGSIPGLPISRERYNEFVATIRNLEALTSVEKLLQLCIRDKK
ncbi:MmgE/PrpD family protein [Chloroflexota bacterium]